MKKFIVLMAVITVTMYGWETNTHRAIDRKAIESSSNLGTFIADSGIDTKYNFINEDFEGYDMSYQSYIKEGEKNGMSKLKQTFTGNDPIRDIIEAGTMLEDAVWPGAWRGNGRFNNHFYEAQNGAQRSFS